MLLSDCYSGRTTDQYICANSSLYSHLVPGDDVMADRGFQIKEDLLHYHRTLRLQDTFASVLQRIAIARLI